MSRELDMAIRTTVVVGALLLGAACTPEQPAPRPSAAPRETRLPPKVAVTWACDDFRKLYNPARKMAKGDVMRIVNTADDAPALVFVATDLAQAWWAGGEDGIPTWRQAGAAFAAACKASGR